MVRKLPAKLALGIHRVRLYMKISIVVPSATISPGCLRSAIYSSYLPSPKLTISLISSPLKVIIRKTYSRKMADKEHHPVETSPPYSEGGSISETYVEVKMEDVGGYTVHKDSSDKGTANPTARASKLSVYFVK